MRFLESIDLRRRLIFFASAVFLIAIGCQSEPSQTQTHTESHPEAGREESAKVGTPLIQEPGDGREKEAQSFTNDLSPEKVASLLREFLSRIEGYIELRQRMEQEVMKPDAEATAEAIQDYQRRLAERLIEARRGASQGDLFAEIQPWFRSTLNSTLTHTNKAVLIENVEELGARQIEPEVNIVYPKDHGLSFVFPKLLRVFPELPEDVQYRFAGTSLILLDRDTLLILDYLPEAYE